MRVPKHVATGKRPVFPQGTFIGSLTEVKSDTKDDGTAALLLTFRDIAPGDDKSPQVNGRPKTQRIQIIDKNPKTQENVFLADVDEFNDDVPLSLQRAATLLTQLGVAFGVGQAAEDGGVDIEMGLFLEDLEAGNFKGTDVVFDVGHRVWYPKGQPKTAANAVTSDDITRFAAAVNVADEPVEVAAPAPVPVAPAAPKLTGRRSR